MPASAVNSGVAGSQKRPFVGSAVHAACEVRELNTFDQSRSCMASKLSAGLAPRRAHRGSVR